MIGKRQEINVLCAHFRATKARHIHSTGIIASRTNSSAESSSASSTPKRSSKNRSDILDPETVDLVGPPDSISNIRPMVYAPSKSFDRRRNKSPSTSANVTQQPHPYSPNEFHQTASSTFSTSQQKPKGLGMFRLYREYVDHVCDRVEEVDMKLRLSKLTTDSTTQRFWRDNNTRFSRDMQAWAQNNNNDQDVRNLSNSIKESSGNNALVKAPKIEENLITAPSSESDFYATWLKANAKRNKAYNVLVWKQAFDQVRLGAQVSIWTYWLKVLRKLEG
ncbi:uncharacterized protein FA14DRAFT_94586 [Meira miltonrushii]|uniref:Uncharacterized protein n=1 Tax=Meira miltonrushii TaxID=1280837 RepID=A0A316V7Q7_9BASI|nr:uncharacterized protein FA14DRAFT_94586 [Meira miltonrushii]PWN31485.1 hypothetical protein FA14DRAFT_94586 [Meira miltonrushii]